MYERGCHTDHVVSRKYFPGFSMHRFGLHIGHLFLEEVFRIYVHGCHMFPEKNKGL